MTESTDRRLREALPELTESDRLILRKFLSRRPAAHHPHAAAPRLGERVADRIARFGGSWGFLGLFGLVLAAWMTYNATESRPFDPFPFILLNLVLSCIAAVQAPVILMTQNRAAQKDREQATADYEVNLKAELEILALHHKLDSLREESWRELVAQQERQIALLESLVSQRS